MPMRPRGKRIPPAIPPPADESPPVVRAVRAFQQSLMERMEELEVPPTPEDVLCEAAAVARMAAASGDLETAVKGYKVVGDLMGLGTAGTPGGGVHNHLHLHQTPANMLDADDDALRSLLQAAKNAKPVTMYEKNPTTSPYTTEALLA